MSTATLLDLELARDGVLLVKATCDRCRKTVLHGAGNDPDALLLGHRLAHCRCPEGYELIDTNGLIPGLLPAIRAEVARRTERQARRAARIAAAGQPSNCAEAHSPGWASH
jgi:hypothetical protein